MGNFQTTSNYLLSFLNFLDSKASIIVREAIDLYFLITALFLAMPGLYLLKDELQKANFINVSSVLLTSWLFIAGFMAVGIFLLNLNLIYKYSLSFVFSQCLFFSLIIGLGFLGYNESYLFFLGTWIALITAVRLLHAFKQRRQAQAVSR